MAGKGSSPGERRGGRQRGVPNKATLELREIAQSYAPAAIAEAARLMKHAKTEAARIGAINIILDRAYGKPPQAITGAGGGPVEFRNLSDLTDEQLAGLESLRTSLVLASSGTGDQSGDREAGG